MVLWPLPHVSGFLSDPVFGAAPVHSESEEKAGTKDVRHY